MFFIWTGALLTSAILKPKSSTSKIFNHHNTFFLYVNEQEKSEQSEHIKFSWSSGRASDGAQQQRRKTEIEQSKDVENESIENDDEVNDDPDASMNPFGEILQLIRSLYESVFFYGLNDSDGARMVDRSKLLKSDDFRKFKSKGLDSVILTEDELVALYLTEVKSKKPTIVQQQQKAKSKSSTDDTDDFNNNAYIFALKKDLLLLKSSIKDIEQQLKINAISLAAAEEDDDNTNIQQLQARQHKLKAQLQQRKVQLITIQANLMDLQ